MKAMTFAETVDVVRFVEDPNYVAQQKMDGMRVMAHWDPDEPWKMEFTQRRGEPVKSTAALPHLPALSYDLAHIVARNGSDYPVTLDGELMQATGEYHLFDLYRPLTPYMDRLEELRRLMQVGRLENYPFKVLPTAYTEESKLALYESVELRGGEGVIFRHREQEYLPGAVSRMDAKFKFVKSADVVVMDWKRGKSPKGSPTGSCSFGVYSPEGELVQVGNCSLIGRPEVAVGDVIEVNYLYWTGEALVQPRMFRKREDKQAAECTLAQFSEYRKEVLWYGR